MNNYPLLKKVMLTLLLLGSTWGSQVLASEQSLQETKITLKLQDVSIETALIEIEKISGFTFFYIVDNLDLTRLISVNANQASLDQVLNELFKNTKIDYRQADNQIILKPRKSLTEKKLSKASLETRSQRSIRNQSVNNIHSYLFVQKQTITGTVKAEENGENLPGVNILEKGTLNGTVTNVDGKYMISVSPGATLVFSSVGYLPMEVIPGDRSVVDATLKTDVQQLQELVVVGYGEQKRADLTSAIATVSAKEIQNFPVANFNNALQGISPGVEVQSNQGRPGSAGTIRIRGVGSIGDTDPLIVVDGVPMGAGAVMPNDIESMEVLKDAASSAIYGSRGANGVILITTKKGKPGKPQLSLSSYYGVEEAWRQLDLMNSAQWADLVTEVNENAGKTPPTMATWIKTNDSNYDGTDSDWQGAMFQQGKIQEHSLALSGGNDYGNYYISGGYFNQEGIMRATAFNRINFRVNSSWTMGKFKFGENISFRYQDRENEDNGGGRSHIEEMLKETGPVKIYDPNRQGGFGGPTSQDGHDANNPVGLSERITNKNFERLFSGVVWGQIEMIKGLKYKMNLGAQSDDNNLLNWQLATDLGPKSINRTSLQERNTWAWRYAWENTMNYQKTFGDHDLNLLVGYTSEFSRSRNFSAQGFDITSEELYVLSLTESDPVVSGGMSEWALSSVLGRIMYSYKGKYLFTANFRRDEVGKFTKKNRVGYFPSFSAGWRISDEPFMSNVTFIDNLKLRASYGTLGNQAPIGNYAAIANLTSGANYTFNNGIPGKLIGVTPRQFANPDLIWETVVQSNIGMDLTLFTGLDITADYYIKETEDMLVNIPIPASSGSVNTLPINAGGVRNSGVEFMATYRKSLGEFNFEVSGNFATIKNEVVSMGVEGGVISAGGVEFNGGGVTRTEAGHPIGSFYGYIADGIFLSEADVENHKNSQGVIIQPDAKPGDVRFIDLNDDGQLSDGGDRTFIGSPIPDLMYGLRLGGDYRGIDFSLFFQGVEGNDVYAELMAWTEGMHNNFNAWTKALDRFPHSTTSGIPRAVRDDPNGNIKKASTRYIHDASYMRLKNVVVGYTLPATLTNSLSIARARVYFSGRNLLTFTKYPFYDPEIGSGALGTGGSENTARGIDNGYYPQARTITFGLQLDF